MSSLNRIPLYLITFWIAQPETGRSLFSFMFSKSCLRWERHVCQVWTFKLLPFLTKLCTKALWLHLLLTWGKNMLIHSYALQKRLKGFLFSKQILCREAAQREHFQFWSSGGFRLFACLFVLIHIICKKRIRKETVLRCLHRSAQCSYKAVTIGVSWAAIRKNQGLVTSRVVREAPGAPGGCACMRGISPPSVPFWCW